MRDSEYKWHHLAVLEMKPGTIIEFRTNKPWGLASYLYRHSKPKDVYITVHKHDKKVIVKRDGEVTVWQDLDWEKGNG